MIDLAPWSRTQDSADRPEVGRVLVAVKFERTRTSVHQQLEEFGHSCLDGLGIRATESALEVLPRLFLSRCHSSLSPERAVRERVEEPGVLSDRKIHVEGEVLGVLEGLEAVDYDRFLDLRVSKELRLKE
ncbi:MAG: hypothetical protein H6682_10675 [Candidatus Eisenbacteria bacterium]|nr:hypothetical protein [Candidatus Eisenbacteria bacterium]